MGKLQQDDTLGRGEVVQAKSELALAGGKTSNVDSPVHQNPQVAVEMILISFESILKFAHSGGIVGSGITSRSWVRRQVGVG